MHTRTYACVHVHRAYERSASDRDVLPRQRQHATVGDQAELRQKVLAFFLNLHIQITKGTNGESLISVYFAL